MASGHLMSKLLNTQQIGKAGELLVQYKLLKYGIDSSSLTTDYGIDLVAYSSRRNDAMTIQVKANEKAKPGGGRGQLTYGWRLRENSPADLVAVASLDSNEVWLFTHKEFADVSQQRSSKGILHFYMYLSDEVKAREKALKSQFNEFLLENRIGKLL